MRLGKAEGVRNGDAITLTLPANNSELAAQIGTVRELVSRNLSRLQAEGLIQVDNRALRDSVVEAPRSGIGSFRRLSIR